MNDYIEHHGIKGMKWGVRRYQNKDGSLTPAGKRRYSLKDEFNMWKDREKFGWEYTNTHKGADGLKAREIRKYANEKMIQKYGEVPYKKFCTHLKVAVGLSVATSLYAMLAPNPLGLR